jgi:hypothetical protein
MHRSPPSCSLGGLGSPRSSAPSERVAILQRLLTCCAAPQPPFLPFCSIAYVYKAKTEKKGSKYRVIWGKVSCCNDGFALRTSCTGGSAVMLASRFSQAAAPRP